jgi:diguanylate cyclase (GGDEF)-like protein
MRIEPKMNSPGKNFPSGEETDQDRMDGLLSDDVLSLDLVSALAGDRPLTKAETLLLEKKKGTLGNKFFSDLLFAVTHQHFEPDIAKALWKEVVLHKYKMSAALKRDIRLVVAALDYLSNITGDILSTTLISEDHIAHIVDVSLHDGLTGLFNHAFFYRRIDFELKILARYGTPVSLMMVDIDDFKDFNDQHGHQEGDAVLSSVGAIIEAETRDADICCRYGGEEFGVVLPSTGRSEALMLAERLRKAIEKNQRDNRKITVSIGIAAASKKQPLHTPQSLVKEADDALYEAKASGKNRVIARE